LWPRNGGYRFEDSPPAPANWNLASSEDDPWLFGDQTCRQPDEILAEVNQRCSVTVAGDYSGFV
jgi:hypothetical protein